MISIAFAKKVTINGSVRVIIVGINIHTATAPRRDKKNKNQNLDVDFFCVSIYCINFHKNKAKKRIFPKDMEKELSEYSHFQFHRNMF